MNIISIVGAVLTFVLTEMMKRNPKLKDHAPLVVTILSAVIGAVQAALAASLATAGEAILIPAATEPDSSYVDYTLTNVVGAVIVDNAKRWGGYFLKRLLGRLLKIT
jgi:uncharacterized membrane protein